MLLCELIRNLNQSRLDRSSQKLTTSWTVAAPLDRSRSVSFPFTIFPSLDFGALVLIPIMSIYTHRAAVIIQKKGFSLVSDNVAWSSILSTFFFFNEWVFLLSIQPYMALTAKPVRFFSIIIQQNDTLQNTCICNKAPSVLFPHLEVLTFFSHVG